MHQNLKQQNGVFYTRGNPFDNGAFKDWARKASIAQTTILEPFAGANHLINHLHDMGLCRHAQSYDIDPADDAVVARDSFADFPKGYRVCITNPPWLARNRATRMGLEFPETPYADLYQVALKKCLDACPWVAMVLPESFIRTGLFEERLTDFISLRDQMFGDTDHPTALALFAPDTTPDVRVWADNRPLGNLADIRSLRPHSVRGDDIIFNHPEGNVGFIAIDNTRQASIRFCRPEELGAYQIKHSCRSITKILVRGRIDIDAWNEWVYNFRQQTADVLLTSFKGLRQDGQYRRRMDFDLARGVMACV